MASIVLSTNTIVASLITERSQYTLRYNDEYRSLR